MADYLPHTSDEVDEMLSFLGMDSLDQLPQQRVGGIVGHGNLQALSLIHI